MYFYVLFHTLFLKVAQLAEYFCILLNPFATLYTCHQITNRIKIIDKNMGGGGLQPFYFIENFALFSRGGGHLL